MKRPSLIGLLILIIGLLFLLSQLHIFTLSHSVFRADVLWPLALALIGLSGLGGNRGKLPLWSIFLVVLGLMLSARNAGVIPVLHQTSGWNLFWGLLIVFVGLQFLLPKRWRHRHHVHVEWKHGPKRTFSSESASHSEAYSRPVGAVNRKWVGDLSIGQHPWVLKDMTLWNGVGDVRLNLGTARVEPGTYHLSLGGWIGDVRILVPEGLAIQVSTNVAIGDVTVFGNKESGMRPVVDYADSDFDTAATKVYVTVDLKIGEVQVVRV